MGVSSSAKLTSGKENIIIGTAAGKDVNTNEFNILIGSGSSAAAGLSNAYAIGTQAHVAQDDSLILGGQTGKRFILKAGQLNQLEQLYLQDLLIRIVHGHQ